MSSLIGGWSHQCSIFFLFFLEKRPELKLNDEAKYVQSIGLKNSEITCGLISACKKLRLIFKCSSEHLSMAIRESTSF